MTSNVKQRYGACSCNDAVVPNPDVFFSTMCTDKLKLSINKNIKLK